MILEVGIRAISGVELLQPERANLQLPVDKCMWKRWITN